MSFDVIVLGLGAMGSAAAQHLAQRGQRVLGLDRFHPPHDQGSSHGGSRIIRQAYFEHPDYIPLVLRAYELWHQLERNSSASLIHTTGGLVLGSRNGELVSRTIDAARQHGIPIDLFEPADLARRFPALKPQAADVGVYEQRAGYLIPEDCIRAQLQAASRAGAELHFDENVLSWSTESGCVQVITADGSYTGRHLVITAGPWANEVLQSIFPLRVTRQVTAWIQPRGGIEPFLPDRFPIFIAEDASGGFAAYGFPAIDGPRGGIKVALHGSDITCTPQTVNRTVHDGDIVRITEALAARIPAINGELVRAKTCLYTVTPDEHFIIGLHPQVPSCAVACGFSGHGFKFAPVVGEVLADLCIDGTTRHSIKRFSPRRFSL